MPDISYKRRLRKHQDRERSYWAKKQAICWASKSRGQIFEESQRKIG